MKEPENLEEQHFWRLTNGAFKWVAQIEYTDNNDKLAFTSNVIGEDESSDEYESRRQQGLKRCRDLEEEHDDDVVAPISQELEEEEDRKVKQKLDAEDDVEAENVEGDEESDDDDDEDEEEDDDDEEDDEEDESDQDSMEESSDEE